MVQYSGARLWLFQLNIIGKIHRNNESILSMHILQQKLEADKLRERELQNDEKSLEHELTESDEQLASRELQLSDLERQLRQDNLQVFCTANNLSLLNSSDGKLRCTLW